MKNKYGLSQYGVGEKLNMKLSCEGVTMQFNYNIMECIIALKKVTPAERDAVSKGIIKAYLSYVEDFAFICLGIGDRLIYEIPLQSHLLSDDEMAYMKDNNFMMPIVLVDFDTNIVQAIRVIGFNKDISKKIYNMIILERQSVSADYYKDVTQLFMKYTTKQVISKSFAGQVFMGEYPMKYTKAFGESGRQVQRYIRLTELIYQLLDKVDEDIIKFIAGVEVSYLDTKHQILLNDVIDYNCCEVNARQGTQIKKHYLDGDLSGDKINEILKGEEIKKPKEKISINYTRLKEYFPKEYTPQQCEQALWEILDKWFRTKE